MNNTPEHLHSMRAVKGLTQVLNDLEVGGVVFGTTSGTACEGNDSRLSDTRTPSSHGNEAHSSTFVTSTDISTHAGLTSSVHGFDSSGNAPAQSHDNTRHTAAYALASDLSTHTGYTTSAHGGILASSAFSGLAKITVGSSAPGSPNTGDLWIDTT